MAKKKKVLKKGKKPHKNKPTSKKYTKYKIEGDKITRAKCCPRCGPGVFLLDSNGRLYCGKCHYAEFKGKASKDVPSEEIKEGKEKK